MNTGMQDAFNLAWKLAMVVKGDAKADRLLDSYDAERSANAAQVLTDSGRMLRIGTMQNVAGQVVRNFLVHQLVGLSFVEHAAAERLSELTVGYAQSPINGGAAKGVTFPKPGQRMAVDAQYGGASRPRFVVVASEHAGANSLLKDYSNIVEELASGPSGGEGICLVRPDGYVAMTAHEGEWDQVGTYLRRLTTT